MMCDDDLEIGRYVGSRDEHTREKEGKCWRFFERIPLPPTAVVVVLWRWPFEMEMEALKCAVFLSTLFSVGGENDTSSGPQSLSLHTPPPPPLASCLTRGQCLHGTEDIEATVNSVENYLDCLILCRF